MADLQIHASMHIRTFHPKFAVEILRLLIYSFSNKGPGVSMS